MSDARSQILDRLRRSLSRADTDASMIESRLTEPPVGPQPSWHEDDLTRFTAQLERASGTVARVASPDEIVAAVTAFIAEHELPGEFVAAPHSALDALDWPAPLEVERRTAKATDVTVLSVAAAGIAETGSLVMLSGPDTPVGLNFLPDNFLCLLPRSAIVKHLEDAWALLRTGRAWPPRTVNLITGPSRTADVEQTIQLGAHGPRRLQVLLLGD